MAWHNFRGAYNNSGPYNNVVVGGNPNSTGDFGVDLRQAHNEGYGYGIQFDDDGNYGVTFTLNLVPYSVSDSGKYIPNAKYVPFGGTYNYICVISTSNDGGKSFKDIFNQIIFRHNDDGSMIYRNGWQDMARGSQWTKKFQLPVDTTHVRIELKGENATFPYYNVYSIQTIIPDFRPMSIRKSGIFKSLDNRFGKLQIRKNGIWKDLPIMTGSDIGKENKGSARIRKNGKWVGQSKVGS